MQFAVLIVQKFMGTCSEIGNGSARPRQAKLAVVADCGETTPMALSFRGS